jgi:NitT/TauT family transport system permease protein
LLDAAYAACNLARVPAEPQPATGQLALVRAIPRKVSWLDLGVLGFIALCAYGVARLSGEWRAPLHEAVAIDLSLRSLPLYTFFSLCRGLAAFALSFFFTLVYGYLAARVRLADRVLLPLLDILQSIPVLGFMPGLVLALAALFPHSNAGLELAAILMIFTGQVWNMTFSFYHSLRAIPDELIEASSIYRFGWWRRFTRVELPYSAVGLIWNGMMSMAGGWFFLTINEAFRRGDRDFRLPGVGAYMSVAIDAGDKGAMLAAIVAMMAMIVLLDQLFWRPLVAWSEKFKFEDVGGGTPPQSWVLDLLRSSELVQAFDRWLRKLALRAGTLLPKRAPPAAASPPKQAVSRGFLVIVALLGAACLWGTVRLVQLLAHLHAQAWAEIASASGLTLLRTTAAVALGSIWTIPAGVYIGTHPKASRVLQPIVQIAASFPAPMLFPIVLALLAGAHLGLGLGSVALMMLGTQWYILFNVVAGAMSIPHELHEAARVYRFEGIQKWKRLYLPGIFPALVTGWVTAAGGAWNASIVSEYVHTAGETRSTAGLGALISVAAEKGDLALLAAGVLTMAALVVLINRLFWKRLYALAERRYSLGR